MPLYLCRYIPTRPAQQFTRRLIHQRSLPASPRGCGEDMYAVEKMAPSLDSSPRHEIFHFLFSEKNRFFYFLLTRLLEWQYSDPSTPNKTKSSCRACFRISFIINSSLIFSSRFRIKKCAITAKRGRLVSNNEGFELKFCGRRLPPWSPSSPQFAKDPILSPGIGLYSPCRSYARFLPWLCHGFWHWSTSLEVPCLSFRELEMGSLYALPDYVLRSGTLKKLHLKSCELNLTGCVRLGSLTSLFLEDILLGDVWNVWRVVFLFLVSLLLLIATQTVIWRCLSEIRWLGRRCCV